MQLTLDRRSGIPLYLQIKNQISRDIRNQKLEAGQRLPTERELSKKLGTSRNTVSAAYRLLEQEGYLESRQGRGTFIAAEEAFVPETNVGEHISLLIDTVLEEAWQSGLSTAEFLEKVESLCHEKEAAKKRVKAVFVECSIEQANVFARELEEYSHFTVTPLVLSELSLNDNATTQLLTEARFVFTTFSHVAEVRDIINAYGKDVYGMAVRPCLEGLIQIARYPKTTRFGVISLSQEFHHKFRRNLMSAKLEGLQVVYTTAQDREQVRKMARNVDVIIVSPGRFEDARELVDSDKDVIVFNTTLDPGSVRAVLLRIAE